MADEKIEPRQAQFKLGKEAEAEIARLAKWWEDGLPLPEIYLRAAMVWAWSNPAAAIERLPEDCQNPHRSSMRREA